MLTPLRGEEKFRADARYAHEPRNPPEENVRMEYIVSHKSILLKNK